eukprot:c27986_g1_i1 orf=732-2147(-)
MAFFRLWSASSLPALPLHLGRLPCRRVGSAHGLCCRNLSKASVPVRYIPKVTKGEGERVELLSLPTQVGKLPALENGCQLQSCGSISDGVERDGESFCSDASQQAIGNVEAVWKKGYEDACQEKNGKTNVCEDGCDFVDRKPVTCVGNGVSLTNGQLSSKTEGRVVSESCEASPRKRTWRKQISRSNVPDGSESEAAGSLYCAEVLGSTDDDKADVNYTIVTNNFNRIKDRCCDNDEVLHESDDFIVDEDGFLPIYGEEREDTGNILSGVGEAQRRLVWNKETDYDADKIEKNRLQDGDSASRAAKLAIKNQAIKYLAMRPLTVAQLRKKLGSWKLSREVVDSAIIDIQNCGLQSDLEYAETYVRSRWNVQSWGPLRIRQGLKLRGVSEENINSALQHVFNDEGDSYGMSKSARDQLVLQAGKQWNRGRNISEDAKVRRIIRWLQYRGFKSNVIKFVLHVLSKQHEQSESG